MRWISVGCSYPARDQPMTVFRSAVFPRPSASGREAKPCLGTMVRSFPTESPQIDLSAVFGDGLTIRHADQLMLYDSNGGLSD